ncbi:hypothetical protein BDF19DRAFT_437511 [Syncephalis fuscata]|nr:hypothetical protein BDF19DRAFT_437511 [Syncephalis fuscata]
MADTHLSAFAICGKYRLTENKTCYLPNNNQYELPSSGDTNAKGVDARSATGTTEDAKKSIEVCVKLLKPPAAHRMLLEPEDTVTSILDKLVSRGVAPEKSAIRLILKGKVLISSRTIRDCGITNGAVIHATVKSAPTEQQQPQPSSSSISESDQIDKNCLSENNDHSIPSIGASTTLVASTLNAEDFWISLAAYLRGQFSSEAETLTALQLFRDAWRSANARTNE